MILVRSTLLGSGHWCVNGVKLSVSYLCLLPNASWSPSAFPLALDISPENGLENSRISPKSILLESLHVCVNKG